ncbi:HD domain-containing protein [Erysipelothrix urinaevulpis]|uniref:HD domain-containing protein n=1 Tax=Erysipelothrix urinaevulpis TaxID=2683717 RepID=UPI00135C7B53|nr:HD domain-containing protein [Erysipelothrix urinaevulpis]
MYDILLKSHFVNGNYRKVQQNELISGTAKHDLSHVLNVVALVESVLIQLDVEANLIESAKIAALLHDVGCVDGKKGHALRSYTMVSDYFVEQNINIPYHDEVLNAIKHHGSGYDRQELITLTLIMCDKLDLTMARLAPEGFETPGIRQLQFIKDVHITIRHHECEIDFLTYKDINVEELNSFSFLDKTFASIGAFCEFNDLTPCVRMDGVVWQRPLMSSL